MEFTINNLKTKGPLCHKHYKNVYNWDYVKYCSDGNTNYIAAYRNDKIIRKFSINDFAYLVAMTDCISGWYEVFNNDTKYENEKCFTAIDVAQMIDIMQEYKRNLKDKEAMNFEAVIEFCKRQLNMQGYEYYWPKKVTKFNSDLHYAIGIKQDDNFNSGEIADVCNGGIKNIHTGKFYKFPKVYIAQ
jgi:hypothetical protein